MAQDLDSILNAAFDERPDLKSAAIKALTQHNTLQPLFADICTYIFSLRSQNNGVSHSNEPPTKKRRLEDGSSVKIEQNDGPRSTMLEAKDISFSLPQRKKLHLRIVQSTSSNGQHIFFHGINPTSGSVEFEYPASSYAYAMRLPVPEKQQKQYNFCLIPKSQDTSKAEPLIWTVNHGPLKSCTIEDAALANIAQGSEDILENALSHILSKTGVELTYPSEKEFASAVREAHRKNDIAYHVKAHRGSKEGFLFFLSNGIFFGFKKPLTFFPFNEIESISYTSVLQRTFNLNITIRPDPEGGTQEIEFSMIDQQDFTGIDMYVKSHQLQDASLAEARRAKKVGKEVKTETNGADEDDGRTEIEKAQQELEDEEDELEEDYDPEEEDDGSGSESDGDDEDYTRGKGTNLVADELGSEAEDVPASEDEAEDGEDEDDAEVEVEAEPEVLVEKKPKVPELIKPKQKLPSHATKPTEMPGYDDDDQL